MDEQRTLQDRIQELINLHLDNTEWLYDATIAISNETNKSIYKRADNLRDLITELVDTETETDYTNPIQAMLSDIITRALAHVDWVQVIKDHEPED